MDIAAQGNRMNWIHQRIGRPLAALAVGALVLGAEYAPAAEYYIDAVNGNDANSGLTPGSAWKSLSRGQAARVNGSFLAGATTVDVRDTSGFLPSGTVNIGGTPYAYSSKSATTFNLDTPLASDVSNNTLVSDSGFGGFQPGDIVNLSGTFQQQSLRYTANGTAANPITYRSADPNNRALISMINYASPGTAPGAVWNDGESGVGNGSNVRFENFDIFVDQNGQGKKAGVQASGADNVDLLGMRINVSGSNGSTSGGWGVRLSDSVANDISQSQIRSRFEPAVEANWAGPNKTSAVNIDHTLIWDSRIGLSGVNGSTIDAENITFIGGTGTGNVSDLWAVISEGTVTLDTSIIFDDPADIDNQTVSALAVGGGGSNTGSGDYNLIYLLDADTSDPFDPKAYDFEITGDTQSWLAGANDIIGIDPELLGLGSDLSSRFPVGSSPFPTDIDPLFARLLPESFAATAGPGGTYLGAFAPIPEPSVGLLMLGGAAGLLVRRRRA